MGRYPIDEFEHTVGDGVWIDLVLLQLDKKRILKHPASCVLSKYPKPVTGAWRACLNVAYGMLQ